jgi:AraC-like DNA-binding protein
MDDLNDTTGELLERVTRLATAGDVLERLAVLVDLDRLVRRQIDRTEAEAIRARYTVTEIARARGVSHQYMSRRVKRVAV